MKTNVLFHLTAWMILLTCLSTLEAAETKTDPATGLAIAKNWNLVATHCMLCHSTKGFTAVRLDRKNWEKIIRTMQEKNGYGNSVISNQRSSITWNKTTAYLKRIIIPKSADLYWIECNVNIDALKVSTDLQINDPISDAEINGNWFDENLIEAYSPSPEPQKTTKSIQSNPSNNAAENYIIKL